MLLTARHGLGESTVEALQESGSDRVLIAGGTAAVSDAVASAVAAAVAAALKNTAVLYTQGDELGDVTELALFVHRPARPWAS